MDELVDFVCQQANLPTSEAQKVVNAVLDYLTLCCPSVLQNSIEVLLQYPTLSDAEQDLLIASRVLFPPGALPTYPEELHI